MATGGVVLAAVPAPAITEDAGAAAATLGGSVAAARPRRAGRVERTVLAWLLLAVAVVVLWPAPWGGTLGLTIVSGHSMEPTYHTGDLVLTVRQPGYAVGEVVSYVVPDGQPGAGGRVIHRIVEADGGTVTTRGDNNAAADPWTFTPSDITGRAVLQLPGVGLLWSPAVFPFLIAIVIGALVTMLLWPSRPDPADAPATTPEEGPDA